MRQNHKTSTKFDQQLKQNIMESWKLEKDY